MNGAAASATMLRASPIFAALDDSELGGIMSGMVERHYTDGTALMVQNDLAEGLFLIREGRVSIGRRLPGGGVAATAAAGVGDVIGEMALVGRSQRRSATALADGDVDVLFLPADLLRAALRRGDAASIKIQRAVGMLMASRIADKVDDIAAALSAAPERFTPRPHRTPPPPHEDDFAPADFLGKLPFFAEMAPANREALAGAARFDAVAAGSPVAAHGAEALTVVVRGAVRVALPHGRGHYQVEVVGPGRVPLAAGHVLGTVLAVQAYAAEASTLVTIDTGLLAECPPSLTVDLMGAVNADLVQSLAALDQVEARIAAMLRSKAAAS
jgi:CRP-like cAMP-binding protein